MIQRNVRLLVLLVVMAWGKVALDDGSEYESMPMPKYSGTHFRITGECISAEATSREDKIGLYIFDYSQTDYETLIRKIQTEDKPRVIIMKTKTGKSGQAYRITDGKRETDDLVTPVVAVEPDAFDKLNAKLLNGGQICEVSLNEVNPYYQIDISPAWNILLMFPTGMTAVGLSISSYYLYGYWRAKIPFDQGYLVLIFEFLASFFRFLYCLDLNGSRRLFHYKVSRAFTTIHIPFGLCSAFLVLIFSSIVLNGRLRSKPIKSFMDYKWLKISLVSVGIALFLLEIVGQLVYYISTEAHAVLTVVVFVIYIITAVVIVGLLIGVSVKIGIAIKNTMFMNLKDLPRASRKKTKKFIRGFLSKMPLASVGFILYILGLGLVAIISGPEETYGAIVAVMGLALASLALTLSYAPKPHEHFRGKDSSQSGTTSRTQSMEEAEDEEAAQFKAEFARVSTLTPKEPEE